MATRRPLVLLNEIREMPSGDSFDTSLLAPFSGSGTFWIVPSQTAFYGADNNASTGVSNRVFVCREFLTVPILIDRLGVRGVTQFTGGKFAIGVWSENGETKLFDSGAIATDGAWGGGNNTIVSFSATTLPVGVYLIGFAFDNTTASVRGSSSNANIVATGNIGSVVLGYATNQMSSGVLPSTLGALTAQNSQVMPVTKFYKS